ncbi:MAG: enoyl-CoA hydratase/isomerase family protein [Phycisphaerales bacterium]|jgi:enoyl-CoA hydratase/carnithine racemase|nr:enoyl-CoA hydratase/isomerase family protein [Phycisphaerales bacterium]
MTTPIIFPITRVDSGPHAGIVTVALEQPGKPVVVLDLELIQRLEATLCAVPAGTSGLVLASASERVFVAGADLNAIMAASDAELAKYLAFASRVFQMLADFPFPTVAAINGAALGGGLELAMHCDGLVACPTAKPYPVGLPEAGLAICPGWGGTNLLPARIDPARAIRMTAEGKPMTFDEAVAAGLFDAVAPDAASLRNVACDLIVKLRGTGAKSPMQRRDGSPWRWIGRTEVAAGVMKSLDSVRHELPQTEAAAAVAGAVEAGLTRGWKTALEVEQRELVRLRHTAPAKAALEAFFARSAKK